MDSFISNAELMFYENRYINQSIILFDFSSKCRIKI